MRKQTRSRAQTQSLEQRIYAQDMRTRNWQGTAQKPTFATIYTPDPGWLCLHPRPAQYVPSEA